MKKIEMFAFVAMVAASTLVGCGSFGPAPIFESDAGLAPITDAGERPRTPSDGGMQMPPEMDAGTDVDRPLSGEECDPDRDAQAFSEGRYGCVREGCESAYLACLRGLREPGVWAWECVPDVGFVCSSTPRPETDAGRPSADTDADAPATGTDAGPAATASDAGSPAAPVDAGPACESGSFVVCPLVCPDGTAWYGGIECDTSRGYFGDCVQIRGLECPAPHTDAGTPAPVDAGTDSGPPAVDAGTDAGMDAGTDAGTDAGPSWTPTGVVRIRIAASTLAEIGAWCPEGGAPDIRLHSGARWYTSCRSSTLDIPVSALPPGPYNATVICQTDTFCPSGGAEPSWAGYQSPIVLGGTLNTVVPSARFPEVSFDGRPAREGTFYCHDTWSRGVRRVQVQVVDSSAPLATGCAGSTGS